MRNLVMSILVSLLFVGCAAQKVIQVPIENNQHQTTEIREVIKDSIVYVEVEKEKIVNVMPADTTSTLQTKYAKSEAKLENGKLKHSLENRRDSIPVKVVYKDVIKIDSVYVKREVPVEVIVEVPIRDNLFWYSIILNVFFVVIVIVKIVLKIRDK